MHTTQKRPVNIYRPLFVATKHPSLHVLSLHELRDKPLMLDHKTYNLPANLRLRIKHSKSAAT